MSTIPRRVPTFIPTHRTSTERLPLDLVPADLRAVLTTFNDADVPIFLTGQALRDLLIDSQIHAGTRVDFLANAEPDHIAAVAQTLPSDIVTLSHVVHRTVRCVSTAAYGERPIHIVPVRTSAPPYRWFKENRLSGLELDLATREITIHALAMDVTGLVHNPFGGLEDLRSRTIGTIIPENRVFRESGAWLLKIAKYVAYYGFEPRRELLRAATQNAGNILDTPRHTWKGEIEKVLLGNHVMEGLQFLHESRALPLLLPEVEAMIGFHKSCPLHHKDLWDHTKRVIHQAERSTVVRWAALMHDIGKVWTRSVTNDNKVHFFRHEDLGALLFLGVAHRLQIDPEEAARIEYVIRSHSRVNLYETEWTDSAVRRLIRDTEGHLADLIAFSKADFTTKSEVKSQQLRRQIAELERRIEEIQHADSVVPPLPSGLGNVIMEKFGLGPGKHIGQIRHWLESEVEQQRLAPHQDAETYICYLRDRWAQLSDILPQSNRSQS
ncbi:MAG: HD domain-containing protein [Myxococcales bacterium]|nr:HD domain-containing protein [Myxococcales bacterium]